MTLIIVLGGKGQNHEPLPKVEIKQIILFGTHQGDVAVL